MKKLKNGGFLAFMKEGFKKNVFVLPDFPDQPQIGQLSRHHSKNLVACNNSVNCKPAVYVFMSTHCLPFTTDMLPFSYVYVVYWCLNLSNVAWFDIT